MTDEAVGSSDIYLGENFAEFLGALLYLDDKAQVDLANELGKSQNAVSMWVMGKQVPRLETVATIAELVGLEPVDLHPLIAIKGKKTKPLENGRASRGERFQPVSAPEQLLGAFAVRARNGNPPLTEVETNLIRDILGITPRETGSESS